MATVYLSPIGNGAQFFTTGGLPLNAGLITTYIAGTTTPQSTYTTPSGAILNANPIVLGADGRTTQEIWLTQGIAYKFILTDSLSNLLGTYDNLSGINDPTYGSLSTEWLPISTTPTYISATQFTMQNNQTLIFTANRRVQVFVSAGTLYGTVVSSSFSGSITTVTVLLDYGALDSGLLTANVGILNAVNQSIPTVLNALSSINGSWPSGYKNKLMNGSFTIWQRGTSYTGVTSGYFSDRMYCNTGGSINIVKSGTPISPNGNFYLIATTTAASSYCNVSQAIERDNVYPLRGRTVTFTGWIQVSGVAFTGVIVPSVFYSNANDTIAGVTTNVTLTVASSITPTTSWQQVKYSFVVPSDAIGLSVSVNLSVSQASGVSIAFSDFQLELGSVATSFDTRSISQELTLCQRYYWQGVIAQRAYAAAASASYSYSVVFPTTMRTTPTIAYIAGGSLSNATQILTEPTQTQARSEITSVASGDSYSSARIWGFNGEL